jgi:hypothetical protein
VAVAVVDWWWSGGDETGKRKRKRGAEAAIEWGFSFFWLGAHVDVKLPGGPCF